MNNIQCTECKEDMIKDDTIWDEDSDCFQVRYTCLDCDTEEFVTQDFDSELSAYDDYSNSEMSSIISNYY